MRNEMKYLIGGVVFGFVFFMILLALVTNVYASEVDELPEIQKSEIVQDEQLEMSELPLMESDQSDGEADQPPQESEIAVAVVQDEQFETNQFAAFQDYEPSALLLEYRRLYEYAKTLNSDDYTEESFVGVTEIIELTDNLLGSYEYWYVFDTEDGYAFDTLTAEMNKALDSLELLSVEPPEEPPDEEPLISSDNGIITGLLAVLVFSSGLRAAT